MWLGGNFCFSLTITIPEKEKVITYPKLKNFSMLHYNFREKIKNVM
jgi:hypothetical protein